MDKALKAAATGLFAVGIVCYMLLIAYIYTGFRADYAALKVMRAGKCPDGICVGKGCKDQK